ncbi:MAG TPA: hypothetical protein VJZ73_13405 [Methylomirabilota bacterium]|nr:hypothetical protein [Methylomirabilota bacterium]
MPRKPVRTVQAECPTPALWRWLLVNVKPFTSSTKHGFVVHDEGRWSEALRAAEGRELSYEITLKAKGRGEVALSVRDGVVIGATGSEPQRYIGLTIEHAGYLAAGRKIPAAAPEVK